MLHSIKIEKLFGRFNYELSIPKEGILIITGPNGYGKTTILRLINDFCNDGIGKIFNYSFKKLSIICDNISVEIKKNKENFKINNYVFPNPLEDLYRREWMSFNKNELDNEYFFDHIFPRKFMQYQNILNQKAYDFDEKLFEQGFIHSIIYKFSKKASRKDVMSKLDELEKALNIIKKIQNSIGKVHFIQEQRLIEKKIVFEDRHRGETKIQYITVIKENSDKLKNELAEIMKEHSSLSISLDSTYVQRLFEADLRSRDSKDLRGRLIELEKKQDKLKKYGLASTTSYHPIILTNDEKINKFELELSIYLDDANAKYQIFESVINKLELYEKIVNEKLRYKKIVLSSNNGIEVKTTEGKMLKLETLSSGEQEILVLFYKLIFESNVNLLLIDEPEISLHIVWQKELMENIKSIVKSNKNVQVIIATHSPQIISNNWDLQIDLGGM